MVVFDPKYEKSGEKFFIKRIIGLPGETIYIDDNGKIYINNEILDEDYGLERILNAGIAKEPITLNENEFFVLGDNRNNSVDSRFAEVGKVNKKDIIGRASSFIIHVN